MGGRCSRPRPMGPVLRPGRCPSCAGVMDVASACTNEEEAMDQSYPVQVTSAAGRAVEPLAVAGQVAAGDPALHRAVLLVDRVRRRHRHRVLRDLVHRPLPPLAVRLQPGGAALVLAGRLLHLQRPGHRPLPAVQPGRGAGLPRDAGRRLPRAALPRPGPGQVVAAGHPAVRHRHRVRRRRRLHRDRRPRGTPGRPMPSTAA